jgi:uncharacterized membrane protein YcaP (DUF421 family)
MDPDGLLAGGANAPFAIIALRSAIMFVVALVLLRLSSRRSLGRHSAFDWVLAVILGSVLSRGVNGNSPLLPTIGAGAVLLTLNRLFAMAAVRWQWFDRLVHGQPIELLRDGQLEEECLRRHDLTRDDVLEDVRNAIQSEDLGQLQKGMLERNGHITVVRREAGLRQQE